MTAIASAGYSPPEQYESDGAQGGMNGHLRPLGPVLPHHHRRRANGGDTGAKASCCTRRQTRHRSWRKSEKGSYSPAFLEAVDRGLRRRELPRVPSTSLQFPQMPFSTAARCRNRVDTRRMSSSFGGSLEFVSPNALAKTTTPPFTVIFCSSSSI